MKDIPTIWVFVFMQVSFSMDWRYCPKLPCIVPLDVSPLHFNYILEHSFHIETVFSCSYPYTHTHTLFVQDKWKLSFSKRNKVKSKLWNEQDILVDKTSEKKSLRKNPEDKIWDDKLNASIIGGVGTINGSIVHVNIHVAKEPRTTTFPAKYKGKLKQNKLTLNYV